MPVYGSFYKLELNDIEKNNLSKGLNMGRGQNSNESKFFEQIFNTSAHAILILDENENIIQSNYGFEKLFQFKNNEIKGKYLDEIITPTDLLGETQRILSEIYRGEQVQFETNRVAKNGSIVNVLITGTKLMLDGDNKTGAYLTYTDISTLKRIEEQMKSTLIEKEMLIREVHHRVKNNLQIVSSLLNLQSRSKEGKSIDEILIECQNRVKAISLVHEKLYQTNNITRIDFNNYIKSLSTKLLLSYGITSSKIRISVNAENIFLPMETAISCGLIINELVTNSIKHAFQQGVQGEVIIDMKYNDESKFILSVKDNGIGLPDNISVEAPRTLGITLIQSLTRQIDAKLETMKNKGTEFKITFSILENKGGNN
jgi:PAS domain S-box-containing protein